MNTYTPVEGAAPVAFFFPPPLAAVFFFLGAYFCKSQSRQNYSES